MASLRKRLAPALALVVGLGLAAGCSKDEEPEVTPEERLAAARTALEETSGVNLRISTDELPPGVNGLLDGEGVVTNDPAFEGSLTVAASGLSVDVEVVAVDDVVYAQLPFRQDFVEIDPADYGAPDPSRLVGDDGVASLLTEATAIEDGGQARDGETVLTTYLATVPGTSVASLLPSADPEADFDAEFRLDDEDRLNRVEITGPFYPGAEPLTYVVELSDYGTDADIVAP